MIIVICYQEQGGGEGEKWEKKTTQIYVCVDDLYLNQTYNIVSFEATDISSCPPDIQSSSYFIKYVGNSIIIIIIIIGNIINNLNTEISTCN